MPFNPFKKPDASAMACQQLEDYRRQLLQYEAAATYNKKMVEYCKESIQRLSTN